MGLLIHQLLLVVALAALGAAGWRLAAAAVPSGLLRVVAAVPLAAASAVLSALALALVGLGASPAALTVAALVIWGACRLSVPAREPRAAEQLRAWCSALTSLERVARAALLGAVIGYGAWVLRHPGLGYDALTYHLALPVAWIHNGRPGSLVSVWDGLPIQNYPLTWEVLVSWVTGIARTFLPATLLTPASLLLLGVSVRAGLRELGVSSRLSWLAAATAAAMPIAVVQLPGPNNDLPDTAWLACAAALAIGAAPWRARDDPERHGALIAVALVAAALCVGTKTTGAPLAVVAIVIGAWRCRRELRRFGPALALAVVVGVVVGGFWYLRNLVDHGSPFWPLSATSWGDPIPAAFRGAVHASFLSHVHAVLHGRVHAYWQVVAGGAVMVVGAVLAPLWARRRAVAWGAILVLASLLLWSASPYTGDAANTALAVGATRYLLPCILAAVVTVALSGRGGGRAELLPAAVLIGALAVCLDHDAVLGFPNAPSTRTVLVAVAIGAVVGLAVELLPRAGAARTRALRSGGAAALGVAAVALLLVALLAPVNGYLPAHAQTGQFDAGLVRYLLARPSFRDSRDPVLVGPISVAILAGARLEHPVTVISGDDRCPVLARQSLHAWVVMEIELADFRYDRHWITCLAGRPHALIAPTFLVYPPRRSD